MGKKVNSKFGKIRHFIKYRTKKIIISGAIVIRYAINIKNNSI